MRKAFIVTSAACTILRVRAARNGPAVFGRPAVCFRCACAIRGGERQGRHMGLDIYQLLLNYQCMQTHDACKIFEALAAGQRLDIFRLLVRHAPAGLVQGDIARELGIPSTNLSFHLKALVQSGLAGVAREGRFMRYRANIPRMLEVIGYLTENCCSGDPEACQRFRDASPAGRILPRRCG